MNGRKKWIKKILDFNQWFVIPAILVLYISSAILMLLGIIRLYVLILEFIESLNQVFDGTENYLIISAGFLGIIDIYLLAIVLYTLAISVYKLFIGNTLAIHWLKVNSLSDLKNQLSKMSILFLSTLLIQKITYWKNPQETLYFAISITIICLVLVWYTKHLDIRKDIAIGHSLEDKPKED